MITDIDVENSIICMKASRTPWYLSIEMESALAYCGLRVRRFGRVRPETPALAQQNSFKMKGVTGSSWQLYGIHEPPGTVRI